MGITYPANVEARKSRRELEKLRIRQGMDKAREAQKKQRDSLK